MADLTNRTLRPFRDYDEHDVINLFRADEDCTIPVHRGTLMMIAGNGWKADEEDGIEMLGAAGANSISNTVSQRYGVSAEVTFTANINSRPIGMTLYDIREEDENGEKLIHNPRKAVEMECVLSGQAVPLVTKGIFLYSGSALAGENPTNGAVLYAGANGTLSVANASSGKPIGRCLGAEDGNGHVLIHLDVTGGWVS